MKYMETVDCELFIMLEGVFCVLLFVWYESDIVCLLSSGTLMQKKIFYLPALCL